MIDVRTAIGQTCRDRKSFQRKTAVPVARPRFLPALVFALALLSPAMSRAGASLYTGQVPVNSQSEADRSEALKAALAQVLVKLAGDNAVLNKPEVAKAVAGAERYVQQYQYTHDAGADAGQPRLNLVAQFDRNALDQLLRDLGLGHVGGDAQQAAADTPAATYQPGSYHVWVSGVNSAEDYARLIGSLSHNELVRGVQAEQARGDGIQLKLDVTGPLSRLLDSLATGPVHVLNAKPPVAGVDALLGMQP